MPSLVEIGLIVLEKKILNFVNVFSLFRNLLPLDKGVALYFNKLESLSPKDALCQVWSKFAQWIWRRRWKCAKFTDGRADSHTFHSLHWMQWWRHMTMYTAVVGLQPFIYSSLWLTITFRYVYKSKQFHQLWILINCLIATVIFVLIHDHSICEYDEFVKVCIERKQNRF